MPMAGQTTGMGPAGTLGSGTSAPEDFTVGDDLTVTDMLSAADLTITDDAVIGDALSCNTLATTGDATIGAGTGFRNLYVRGNTGGGNGAAVHVGTTTAPAIGRLKWSSDTAEFIFESDYIGGAAFGSIVFRVAESIDALRLKQSGAAVFGRIAQQKQGAAVASAATITLGGGGNVYSLTGTTTVGYITTTDIQAGTRITLITTGILTLTNNAAAVPANTAALLNASGANITTAADRAYSYVYNGTHWIQD